VRDALSGTTPGGRAFWAFSFMYLPLKGAPPSAFRAVAFVSTGLPLPTVSVVSRAEHVASRRVGIFGPLVGRLERKAARAAAPRAGTESEVVVRLDGWPVGSNEFRGHYKVEAEGRDAAEWLVGAAVERALLAAPWVSLAANRSDLLAWCDRGYLSIAVVDVLVEVLDAVGFPPQG